MMQNKKILIITASVVIPLVIFGIFIGSTDFTKEDNVDKNQVPVHIESEEKITHLTYTNSIKDIKDDVAYTILGTISSVGYDGELIEWDNAGQILGFFPIILSVDTVYKGDWTDETFTFYLTFEKYGDGEYSPIEERYMVGDKHLFHFQLLDMSRFDDYPFPDGNYIIAIPQYGEYKIESSPVAAASGMNGTITNDNENLLAFNPHYPDGVSLDVVSGEALP